MTGAAANGPMMRTLGGEAVWPPPVWLMRQAGRYLPEYRALRAQAGSFLALCLDPARAAEATVQPVRRFGMDAAILFSDILILPWALGWGLEFREGEGPVLPRFAGEADLARLEPGRVEAAVAPVLETIARVRAALAPDVALLGFAGAPFTVAAYMIEGGGARDFARARAMAQAEPGLFGRLMALLEEATGRYLSAQIAAGVDAVMVFDSWAGLLSPRLFARHAITPMAGVAALLAQRHPGVPVIGFPRLAGSMLGGYARALPLAAIGLDTGADLEVALALLGAGTAGQGNLDPAALLAGGRALAEETAAILAAARGRRFVFNLGHGVLPETPPAHVGELIARVRAG